MRKNTPSTPVRATLSLRGVAPHAVQPSKAPPAPAVPAGTPPPPRDDVPDDAPVSFVNWRAGFRRPTRRYLTRETALAEARRLRESESGAVVHTYELRIITEDAP